MKAIGSLVILLLMILGLERAFLFKEVASAPLSTRQKIELTYRNAMAQFVGDPLDDEAVKVVENEIQDLVAQDPFLNKKDRLWVKVKLKSLKSETPAPLAMGSPE